MEIEKDLNETRQLSEDVTGTSDALKDLQDNFRSAAGVLEKAKGVIDRLKATLLDTLEVR